VEKVKEMTRAELLFGKLGYNRRELNNGRVIVYYKIANGVEFDDITFCVVSKKIIFFQGNNFGPNEFKMDYRLLKPILYQCNELGWHFDEPTIEVKKEEDDKHE
jgi:hypothetical protein